MNLFIGARTHATIAALSSGVPTLSLSYSNKSKGINRDIFGNELYLLDGTNISPQSISKKIDYMLGNLKTIKNDLCLKIPEIQIKALMAGKYLQEIIEV
jgi:polysaccharide pyruvyl transferase WcaK-like protein